MLSLISSVRFSPASGFTPTFPSGRPTPKHTNTQSHLPLVFVSVCMSQTNGKQPALKVKHTHTHIQVPSGLAAKVLLSSTWARKRGTLNQLKCQELRWCQHNVKFFRATSTQSCKTDAKPKILISAAQNKRILCRNIMGEFVRMLQQKQINIASLNWVHISNKFARKCMKLGTHIDHIGTNN